MSDTGQVRAVVRGPSGAVVELLPGAIIGRMRRCDLCIEDGRISEADALVSLRGQALLLLPRRGRFTCEGRQRTELALEPGQRVELAPGVVMEVLEVVLPELVLAIALTGTPAQVPLGTTSVMLAPSPTLAAGWMPGAAARIWSQETGWWIDLPGHASAPLREGQVFELAPGVTLAATLQPLHAAGPAPTSLEGGHDAPLHIVARFHTVHISSGGRERCVLDGIAARCVSELVAFQGPTPWQLVARELWPERIDEVLLRGRWDTTLARVRTRLRQAGLRADLVRSTNAGQVELSLRPGDALLDET